MTKGDLQKHIDEALDELDDLVGELRVKLHVAGDCTSVTWRCSVEPLLFAVRLRAEELTAVSLATIQDVVSELYQLTQLAEDNGRFLTLDEISSLAQAESA